MAKTEKVTVTLPVEHIAAIRARVAEGESESVSGFVQMAVQQALDVLVEFQAVLTADLMESGGPPSEAEIAWADAVLGRGAPPRDPGPYPNPDRIQP